MANENQNIIGAWQDMARPAPKKLRVLVACEYSGIVRDAFIALGHEAMSCDLLPTESPGPHYQGDVRDVLCYPWDLMVAHPPCTDLAVSGAAWFQDKRTNGSQYASASFFMQLAKADIPQIAIENPVCIMSKLWRRPDQIVNPFQFGDPVSKKTCLWLKNLPQLIPTNIVKGSRYIESSSGRRYPEWCWNTGGGTGKKRSEFFPGIAAAMAEQWGGRPHVLCSGSPAQNTVEICHTAPNTAMAKCQQVEMEL